MGRNCSCLVGDTTLCFWKDFFRQKGLWGGLGMIQKRSRALFYTHFKPAMASEDITILCLLCPMLESKPAWKNKFVVVSVQHVASYMNTITLILSFKWKYWSWKYFPLSHHHWPSAGVCREQAGPWTIWIYGVHQYSLFLTHLMLPSITLKYIPFTCCWVNFWGNSTSSICWACVKTSKHGDCLKYCICLKKQPAKRSSRDALYLHPVGDWETQLMLPKLF